MFRYRLRTLLILLAVGPPMLAGVWQRWQAWQAKVEHDQLVKLISAYRHETGDYPRASTPMSP